MELQYVFDYACRAKEGDKNFGYKLPNGKCYDRYMSNDAWKKFRKEMEENDEDHYKQYKDGNGNELDAGRYPPKMACYGSSSRFIYNLLKGEDVIFEKKLDTKVGGTANLDAYLCKDDTEIFIEAKSREIYGSKNKVVKNAYKAVYVHIKTELFPCFDYNNNDSTGEKKDDKFTCEFSYNGNSVAYLDMKQLICHFLAITANYLQNDSAKDNIRFIYLIYNPKELNDKRLNDRYDKVIGEINDNEDNIKELFKAVFNYQQKELKITKPMPKFEFFLADQDTIKKHI